MAEIALYYHDTTIHETLYQRGIELVALNIDRITTYGIEHVLKKIKFQHIHLCICDQY